MYQNVIIMVSINNSILCGTPHGVDEHRSSSNNIDLERSILIEVVINSLRPKPSQISISLEHPNSMWLRSSASTMQTRQLTIDPI
jgi:hypothetical protein